MAVYTYTEDDKSKGVIREFRGQHGRMRLAWELIHQTNATAHASTGDHHTTYLSTTPSSDASQTRPHTSNVRPSLCRNPATLRTSLKTCDRVRIAPHDLVLD